MVRISDYYSRAPFVATYILIQSADVQPKEKVDEFSRRNITDYSSSSASFSTSSYQRATRSYSAPTTFLRLETRGTGVHYIPSAAPLITLVGAPFLSSFFK